MSRRDLRSVPRLNASSGCSRATAVVEVRDRWDRRFHHPDRMRFTCAWTCKIFSRLGDRGRRRGWKRRYPPSRGLPHIPPNEPCSPVSFRPQAPRALAACGANYKRWDNVTRDPLSPDVLELVPELREFVPPAGVIDRLGCGQQALFLHRSDRATASDLFSRTLLALRSKCAAFLPQTLQPQSCAGRWQQLILGRGGRAKRIEEQ